MRLLRLLNSSQDFQELFGKEFLGLVITICGISCTVIHRDMLLIMGYEYG